MHSQRLLQQLRRLNALVRFKTGGSQCPPDVLEELEVGFCNLSKSTSESLLKKHLTVSMFNKLKTRTTPTFKSTLLDCIRSGLCENNARLGICAADPEAYTTFADIFDPIIADYHKGLKINHPASCFGYGSDFPNLDPQNRFIISTKLRCARSVKNYPFNVRLSACDYVGVEQMVRTALCTLGNEHYGQYFKICDMNQKTRRQLVCDKLLFMKGNRFLKVAGGLCYWPLGRGVFLNNDRTFLVWVNEEDHIRVISMQKGGDLGQVYERFIVGIESLKCSLQFWQDKRLGYLTFCPTNLGTGIRASVLIKLSHLGEDQAKLVETTRKLGLQIRGTKGEGTKVSQNVFDISNRKCLGLTEYQIITEVYNGVKTLIDMECRLCRKK